ncbi:hypothetical protein BKA70DRAFT_1099609, partial [Coprinopsis sp. MPI-PUGE-AT-0042]
YTERLHIKMAKDAYRSTNHKDEYPQMTAWLDRCERVLYHDKFIQRRLANQSTPHTFTGYPTLTQPCILKMASRPSASASFDDLENEYGAKDFELNLAKFIVHYNHLSMSKREVAIQAESFHIPFQKVPVYHRVTFVSTDPYATDPSAENVVDSIHVEPPRREEMRGNLLPGRFNTALFCIRSELLEDSDSFKNYCVRRLRCIFSLPAAARHCFPSKTPPSHLAYVEWFTPFSKVQPGRHHGMYTVSHVHDKGVPRVSIIPVTLIESSSHLIPNFGPVAPIVWKSSNVLDLASSFYVNPFSICFMYSLSRL